VGPAREIPLADLTDARAHGLVREIGPELEQAYLEGILAPRLHPGEGTDLTIVYTPMHGVGGPLALEALRRAGFANVHPVPEQLQPDPAFPTVRFPNPEEPGAMDLSRALAERTRADLVLANDPDADRLAVLTREASGELRALTGNEVGVLLGHYLLTQGPRRERPLVMTTIVSSTQLGANRAAAGRALRRDAHRLQMDRQPRPGARGEGRRRAGVRLRGGPWLHRGHPGAGQGRHRRGGVHGRSRRLDARRGTTVAGYLEAIEREFGVYVSKQRSFAFPARAGPRPSPV
jgi:phosphomannomutase